MNVNEFFDRLYGQVEGEAYMVVGLKDGSFKSHHIGDRLHLDEYQGKEDIYFRTCPVGQPPTHGRGKQDKSYVLAFLWLDVDCGEKKKGKVHFPTVEEALKWIENYIPYTIIVRSGTGLHVYLVLSSPVYITDQRSFEEAYLLSKRFQQWAKDMCPYDLDSTHDLARVLRIPGSIHSGTGRPVVIHSFCDRSVEKDMIEKLPVSRKLSGPVTVNSDELGFTLDPNCKLNTQLLIQLSTINPKFSETWTKQRGPEDRTPSGWRFSMLSFLTQAGLDKQDVVDMTMRFLIDQCGYAPDQLRIDRPEVWASEIAKCEVDSLSTDDIEAIIESDDREKQIMAIAALMDFPNPTVVKNVSRFFVMSGGDIISDTVLHVHIETRDGIKKVNLPDPLSRQTCQRHIFNNTGIPFPYYTGKQASMPNEKWRKAVQIAWNMADEYEPVEADTSAQLLRAIKNYVNNEEMADSLEEARETGRPFLDGSMYVVPTAALNAHATITYPDLRSNREMHQATLGLRNVGIKKQSQTYKGVRMACLLVPTRLVESDGE
jgi:hypothetical protein